MASCLWVDEIINKGVGMAEGKEVYKSEEKQVRYAIVRVGKDGSCVESFVCSGNCQKCDYGDTKEDMIKKIATAIRRINVKVNNMEIIYISETGLAQEIVKYLGVK